MAQDKHIIIDIPEAELDFNDPNWKEKVKRDFLELQKSLESKPKAGSPTYYTWFLFMIKYGRVLSSSEGQNYLKSNNQSVFDLVKDAAGLAMSSGGAYTIGYKFYEECIKKHVDLEESAIRILTTERARIKNVSNTSVLPYLTAIRTKPFLLLAGISGTGKSRIVRKLAQATDDIDFTKEYDGEDRWKLHKPANFELIQVKPNWHNSMDVVGYYSSISQEYKLTPFVEFIARAWQHPDTPFFLCLDEMNLAPVEEYFAEFLSAIESRSINAAGEYETDPIIPAFDSFGPEAAGKMIGQLVKMNLDQDKKIENHFRKKGLTLPKNLIVMGTVNMDETTFSFSRKVLDRALSIEMNRVDYDEFLAGATEENVSLLTDCNSLLVNRPINAQDVKNEIDAATVIGYLKKINSILDGTPFMLGYRAANEALLYVASAKMLGCDNIGLALDQFTVMKILSRIEGDESKLKTKNEKELLPELLNLVYEQFAGDEDTASYQKLEAMNRTLKNEHFVSFWG